MLAKLYQHDHKVDSFPFEKYEPLEKYTDSKGWYLDHNIAIEFGEIIYCHEEEDLEEFFSYKDNIERIEEHQILIRVELYDDAQQLIAENHIDETQVQAFINQNRPKWLIWNKKARMEFHSVFYFALIIIVLGFLMALIEYPVNLIFFLSGMAFGFFALKYGIRVSIKRYEAKMSLFDKKGE